MLFLYQLWRGRSFQASFTHAILSSLGMILLYIWPSSTIASISLINSLLYFIADIFNRIDRIKIIHHSIAGYACLEVLLQFSSLQIAAAQGCGILELSSPFWALLRLRLENSNEIPLPQWYNRLVAGIIFIITFFISRFICFPYFFYSFHHSPPENVPWTQIYFIVALLMSMNTYWLILLIRGLIKEVSKLK